MIAGGYGSIIVTIKNKYPFLGKVVSLIYPPRTILNTMPKSVIKQVKDLLFNFGKNKVLNIGCGSSIGCGRRIWSKIDRTKILNVDLESGPDVDMIADAHNLPFENDTFDSVIMQAVIEHLHSPKIAVDEAFRVLKKGGYLYLEVPFLQGFHADPHDYQRYTQVGLEKLVEKFNNVLLSGVSVGPICSLIWILRDLFSNLTNFTIINYIIRFIISWILSPFRYLDYLIYNTRASKRLACEYYILIQK